MVFQGATNRHPIFHSRCTIWSNHWHIRRDSKPRSLNRRTGTLERCLCSFRANELEPLPLRGQFRVLNRRDSTLWRSLVSNDLTADEIPRTASHQRFAHRADTPLVRHGRRGFSSAEAYPSKNRSPMKGNRFFDGDPGGIRTHGLSLRRRPLYPAELRDHILQDFRGDAAKYRCG